MWEPSGIQRRDDDDEVSTTNWSPASLHQWNMSVNAAAGRGGGTPAANSAANSNLQSQQQQAANILMAARQQKQQQQQLSSGKVATANTPASPTPAAGGGGVYQPQQRAQSTGRTVTFGGDPLRNTAASASPQQQGGILAPTLATNNPLSGGVGVGVGGLSSSRPTIASVLKGGSGGGGRGGTISPSNLIRATSQTPPPPAGSQAPLSRYQQLLNEQIQFEEERRRQQQQQLLANAQNNNNNNGGGGRAESFGSTPHNNDNNSRQQQSSPPLTTRYFNHHNSFSDDNAANPSSVSRSSIAATDMSGVVGGNLSTVYLNNNNNVAAPHQSVSPLFPQSAPTMNAAGDGDSNNNPSSAPAAGIRPRSSTTVKELERMYGGIDADARERALGWVRQAERHEVACYQQHRSKNVYERHAVSLGRNQLLESAALPASALASMKSLAAANARKNASRAMAHKVDVIGSMPERIRDQRMRARSGHASSGGWYSARQLSLTRSRSGGRGSVAASASYSTSATAIVGGAADPRDEEFRWARGKAFTMAPLRPFRDGRFETPGPGAYYIPSEFQGPIKSGTAALV